MLSILKQLKYSNDAAVNAKTEAVTMWDTGLIALASKKVVARFTKIQTLLQYLVEYYTDYARNVQRGATGARTLNALYEGKKNARHFSLQMMHRASRKDSWTMTPIYAQLHIETTYDEATRRFRPDVNVKIENVKIEKQVKSVARAALEEYTNSALVQRALFKHITSTPPSSLKSTMLFIKNSNDTSRSAELSIGRSFLSAAFFALLRSSHHYCQ